MQLSNKHPNRRPIHLAGSRAGCAIPVGSAAGSEMDSAGGGESGARERRSSWSDTKAELEKFIELRAAANNEPFERRKLALISPSIGQIRLETEPTELSTFQGLPPIVCAASDVSATWPLWAQTGSHNGLYANSLRSSAHGTNLKRLPARKAFASTARSASAAAILLVRTDCETKLGCHCGHSGIAVCSGPSNAASLLAQVAFRARSAQTRAPSAALPAPVSRAANSISRWMVVGGLGRRVE